MTKRYFQATDGKVTVFRAAEWKEYTGAFWLSRDNGAAYAISFTGKALASSHHPTSEITKAEYDALVARKVERLKAQGFDAARYASPQDSWVWNEAPTRTLTWNTKAAYTAEGQVITLRVDFATRQVIFRDHSRGIAGLCRNLIPSRFGPDTHEMELKGWLHTEYLHNRYDYDRSGAADALQRVEAQAPEQHRAGRGRRVDQAIAKRVAAARGTLCTLLATVALVGALGAAQAQTPTQAWKDAVAAGTQDPGALSCIDTVEGCFAAETQAKPVTSTQQWLADMKAKYPEAAPAPRVIVQDGYYRVEKPLPMCFQVLGVQQDCWNMPAGVILKITHVEGGKVAYGWLVPAHAVSATSSVGQIITIGTKDLGARMSCEAVRYDSTVPYQSTKMIRFDCSPVEY